MMASASGNTRAPCSAAMASARTATGSVAATSRAKRVVFQVLSVYRGNAPGTNKSDRNQNGSPVIIR
ncbi:hypothetical protein [Pectobacterium versatile]|uniref:hypothetical protein n=1 Tax=Pectobacterium versatile TaxID=2488639 RepID=UPI00201642C3|nr:hypothetical protein [Pectobacterium versatile]